MCANGFGDVLKGDLAPKGCLVPNPSLGPDGDGRVVLLGGSGFGALVSFMVFSISSSK